MGHRRQLRVRALITPAGPSFCANVMTLRTANGDSSEMSCMPTGIVTTFKSMTPVEASRHRE